MNYSMNMISGITHFNLFPFIIEMYFSNKIHRMTYTLDIAYSFVSTEKRKTDCKRFIEITTSFTEITISENNEQLKHFIVQGRAIKML